MGEEEIFKGSKVIWNPNLNPELLAFLKKHFGRHPRKVLMVIIGHREVKYISINTPRGQTSFSIRWFIPSK